MGLERIISEILYILLMNIMVKIKEYHCEAISGGVGYISFERSFDWHYIEVIQKKLFSRLWPGPSELLFTKSLLAGWLIKGQGSICKENNSHAY